MNPSANKGYLKAIRKTPHELRFGGVSVYFGIAVFFQPSVYVCIYRACLKIKRYLTAQYNGNNTKQEPQRTKTILQGSCYFCGHARVKWGSRQAFYYLLCIENTDFTVLFECVSGVSGKLKHSYLLNSQQF